MVSLTVYNMLKVAPEYISSYDARMRSFPELLAIRKFNKKGNVYPYSHIKKALDENTLILFGSYPFDCDKKCVMMNVVSEKYPGIPWIYNKKGELKKENYDSCDALVCALAHSNTKRYGELVPQIISYNVEETEENIIVEYVMRVWDKDYKKKIVLEIPPKKVQEKK